MDRPEIRPEDCLEDRPEDWPEYRPEDHLERAEHAARPGGGAPGVAPCAAWRAVARGVTQSAAVVAAFVALGLGAALAGHPAAPAAPYTGTSMAAEAPARWLVDGFNVLHAGVLRGRDRAGWWREEARTRLLARVASFEDPAPEIIVVFDGPREAASQGTPESPSDARIRVVFAPSADAWLLRAVRDAPDPASLVVVTADRQLADRARHRGARVVSPSDFLARCGPPEGGASKRVAQGGADDGEI